MQRYGAKVAVKTFVDCGEDRGQLEFLLKKLSLSAVKRSPPLSETEWQSFLDDVLRFQKSVFKSVDPSDCIKVFNSSCGLSSSLMLFVFSVNEG